MIDQKYYKKDKEFSLSKASIMIPLGAIVFYLLCLIFDPGPLVPPFNNKLSSIDCNSIKYLKSEENHGEMSFYLEAGQSVEYPNQYLPHFLNVVSNSTNYNLHFTSKNIKNISRSGKSINFTIEYPFYGKSQLTMKCLKKDIARFTVLATDATNYTGGMSIMRDPHGDVMNFEKVCWEENQIFFLSHVDTKFHSFKFDDTKIKVDVYPWEPESYTEYKNISQTNGTTFVIGQFDTQGWKAVLFVAQPIAASVDHNSDKDNKPNFIYLNTLPKGSPEILKKFTVTPPSRIKELAFFRKLVFVNTRSNVTQNDEDLIRIALRSNFTALRNAFSRYRHSPKRITLPSCMSHLEKPTKEVCPDCEIASLGPRVDIIGAADNVAKSSILVANHLNNFVHAIWLSPNKTTVIDASPNDVRCINWTEQFVKNLGPKYLATEATKQRHCRCKTFKCMSQNPQINGEIDIEDYKMQLRLALNFTS